MDFRMKFQEIQRMQPHAENGRTIVAMVHGEATVKRFYQNGRDIELRPANSRMESLRTLADDVEILGTVVGLLRHYRRRPPRNV